MGYGAYSESSRTLRATSKGYKTKPKEEIFLSRSMPPTMDPANQGADLREARDSTDHPCSVPVILALDVTGSMGKIPHQLIRDGLPKIVTRLQQYGIADPAILFAAIGDHECDRAPLQIGQFESSDDLLDQWLETVWLEGMGGGNQGESYGLAWYFSGFHTVHDHMEKRGHRGYLITVGDEPNLRSYPASSIGEIMKDNVKQPASYTDEELLEAAQRLYHVHHINVRSGSRGREGRTIDYWRERLGQDFVEVEGPHDVAQAVADIVHQGEQRSAPETIQATPTVPEEPVSEDPVTEEPTKDDPPRVNL